MSWYWVYGAIALLSLVHLAVLAYAYHNGDRRRPEVGGSKESVSGDRVECPDCGAANDRGYRYCRACVSELPGHLSFENTSTSPRSRGML